MTLKEYREKRRFAQSTEPQGKLERENKNRFVVQKHAASHLHYDFRLELPESISGGGIVLKSWAVPKGIPEKENIKRLAVQTEDHPVAYLDFEGNIPTGEYGAGTVRIWDRGKFKLLQRKEDLIEFELFGKKLTGRYLLFKPLGFAAKNWLLLKVGN